MNSKVLILIILSVGISAIAQIALRQGMITPNIQEAINHLDKSRISLFITIFTNKYVLAGLSMYGFGAILWLFVLSKIEVSMAYPFVGLGFILTMILGFTLLGEAVTFVKVIGTVFVTIGVILISYN